MKKGIKRVPMIPLITIIDWWEKQKVHCDRGGSFNLDLYLSICRAKQLKQMEA